MPARREVGEWGEAIAARHLIARGFDIVARNWRPGRLAPEDRNTRASHGELDLVALRGGVVHVVEVRARRGDAHGTPGETITPRKRVRLIQTAQAYLDAHGLSDAQWQIDVVLIEFDARNVVTSLEHIEAAFGAPA